MKKLCMIFAVVLLFAAPAGAVTNLGEWAVGNYNQQDSPCVIGYSCGPNLGVDYTVWSEPVPDQGSISSPTYTGAQLALLLSEVGNTPLIALDINQIGGVGNPYMVEALNVFINGSLAFQLPSPPDTLLQNQTGNGVSDYVVPGLNLAGATSVRFDFTYGNSAGTTGDNNDGKELLFLVRAGTPQVPEPGSLLLLGLGLFGMGAVGRKFKK